MEWLGQTMFDFNAHFSVSRWKPFWWVCSTMRFKMSFPLSPFLFTIVAEGLSGFVREAVAKKLFQSFLIGRNAIKVNLLQYVDGTIFFGDASYSNVTTIKSMLRSYEIIFGLKVNFYKNSHWSMHINYSRVSQ